MENITLKVIQASKILFQSDEHWLIPLFDFEDYLRDHPLDLSTVEVYDKVIGKAAALLMIRFGVGSVHAGVISDLAQGVLNLTPIPYTYETRVERIDCQTEEILREINDPEMAYQILCKRAKRC